MRRMGMIGIIASLGLGFIAFTFVFWHQEANAGGLHSLGYQIETTGKIVGVIAAYFLIFSIRALILSYKK